MPFLFGLGTGPTSPVAADELSNAIARQKALEKQIASQKAQVAKLNGLQTDLRSQIATTQKALGDINADLTAVRAQITEMAARIEEVRKTYDNLVLQLRILDQELGRLTAQEQQKRAELRERKALLAERIRTAYETDQRSSLELFLSGGSFTDILSEVSYNIDAAEQDKALAEQITRDKETLEAISQTVEATRGQTDTLRKETAAQKRELDARMEDLESAQARLKELEAATQRELATQQEAYAKLAANQAALKESIAAAAAAQRQLQEKIERLVREQTSRGRIASQYNGSFEWPLVGRITQDFGCTGFSWEAPAPGCPSGFHRGIDIVRADGAPVRAAGDGVIVFVGYNPYDAPGPQAWIVIIAHSQSLQTWYGHMKPTRPTGVYQGATVRQGQVIGYQGSTGRSTGSHLHWAVMRDGDWVNPRLFL